VDRLELVIRRAEQDRAKQADELARVRGELDGAKRALQEQRSEFVAAVAERERAHLAAARAAHTRAAAMHRRAALERAAAEADLLALLEDTRAHRDDLRARVDEALLMLSVERRRGGFALAMVHVECLDPIEDALKTPAGPHRPAPADAPTPRPPSGAGGPAALQGPASAARG
jgi:hypothetical protein